MFIIEVIPIAKSIGADTLSYFTSKIIPLGAIVEVPLRSKKIKAIVISAKSAMDMKSEIKSASFSLKKLDKIKSTTFFSKEFISMAHSASEYYATSIGSVLNTMAPDYILKNISKLKIDKTERVVKTSHEKCAVQGDDDERYGTWKSMIRQEFARKKSIFFLFPTVEEAQYAFTLLEKGVEGYAFLLHGSLLEKDMLDTWNKVVKEKHPVVIIATGGFLCLARQDMETIVIEKESSKFYKIRRKPFLDVRHVAELMAEKMGIKIFFADNFLRLETLWKHSEGEITESSPFKFRSLSTANASLIDMKKYKGPTKNEGVSFKILSEETENLIARTKNESEHMLILATRRGLAGSIVCGDCQNIVTCNSCSAPVVLHSSFLLCHHCGERRSAEENCKVCGSWKLGAVGIGIDLVEKKIMDRFPDISLFRIDSDTVKNDKSAHAIIQKYRNKPGSILLGTEMMLQYVHDKVENSAIISLDSLFSLPDFRIHEKILSILIHMRILTTRDFIVQTRKSDEKVFEYGLKGNTSNFFHDSIEERKKLNYPPFSVLIKITLEGKKDIIVKEMEKIQTLLEPYEVDVFPAFTHTIKGNYVLHGLLRIPRDKWVEPELMNKLRILPPSATIKVDPETLL